MSNTNHVGDKLQARSDTVLDIATTMGTTGLNFDARRAARAGYADMKAEIASNENLNEAFYAVLPKSKKDALAELSDFSTLITILDGTVRKLHFTSLYLLDKCMIKHIKPTMYSYCHDYGAFLEHNCIEIKNGLDIAMASMISVYRGVQQLLEEKAALQEKFQSLAQALATANRTMEMTAQVKEPDIMDNIPAHIKEEVMYFSVTLVLFRCFL